MSLSGNIYGVVLNDCDQLTAMQPQFVAKPYMATPKAPVVYMKPLAAIAKGPVSAGTGTLLCAPTLALLMARDAASVSVDDALSCVGALALAVDLALPETSYYRPAVAQKNGDAFLALGRWVAPVFPQQIRTFVNGAIVHEWGLGRLLRNPATLIAALTEFMTLKAGDVLLLGLPGDAPTVCAGQHVQVEAEALFALHVEIVP